MKRLIFQFVLACVCGALVACGGGGGGTPGPASPTGTFQLRTAYTNLLTQAGTYNFSISEVLSDGTATTGSGSLVIGPSSVTQFRGQSAQQFTVSTSTTLTPAIFLTAYVDANLLPLGVSQPSDFQVYGSTTIPVSASVGASGSLNTINHYTDSSESAPKGFDTVTYALEADTATTALLKIVTASKDTSGNLTDTTTEVYRVTPAGSVTWISQTTVYSTGARITLTF